VTIDNPVPYFGYHQSKIRSWGKLPRRLVLEMKQADKVKIMSIIAGQINKSLEWWNYWKQ
jgi:hypothetical protein